MVPQIHICNYRSLVLPSHTSKARSLLGQEKSKVDIARSFNDDKETGTEIRLVFTTLSLSINDANIDLVAALVLLASVPPAAVKPGSGLPSAFAPAAAVNKSASRTPGLVASAIIFCALLLRFSHIAKKRLGFRRNDGGMLASAVVPVNQHNSLTNASL